MRKSASTDETDDLSQAWGKLLTLFLARRDEMFEVLGSQELTPPHGLAMASLVQGPRRMGDLAAEMACDASYITTVVDRLESLGLAERQPSATDRRVKEIVLTARGREVAARIRATMTSAPAEFGRLSASERATLAALLAKVVPGDEAPNPLRFPNVRRR